ncbi:MAG: Gfo/Idh/MocA family protein [Rhodospirillales bacterium]
MRFLIQGLGSIGRRHLAAVRSAFPDSQPIIWRHGGGEIPDGAVGVCSLEEALAAKPDAAIIATPAPFHLAAAMGLAEAGVPLLVEKPLSATLGGVESLGDILAENDVILRVGYCLRETKVVKCLQSALGRLGGLRQARFTVGQHLADWRPGTDYRNGISARIDRGGGALLELSHEIDLALLLTGLPDTVSAQLDMGTHLGLPVEEAANLVLERPGFMATVMLDFWSRPAHRAGWIEGENGRLSYDFLAGRVTFDAGRQSDVLLDGANIETDELLSDQLRAFVGVISGDADGLCQLDEAAHVLSVIDAARLSAVLEAKPKPLHGWPL